MQDTANSQSATGVHTSPAESESLTVAIVEAVAQAKGTKPATPLYDMINPDALQALYEQAAPKVSFDYVGYEVTIYPDQTISVSDPEKQNNS